MHRKEGEIGEERLVLVSGDEFDGLIRDPVGSFRIVFGIGWRLGCRRIEELVFTFEPWSEALRIGRILAVPEMPFARKEGSVTSVAQTFGDRDFLERKMVCVRRWQKFAGTISADVIGDAKSRRVFSRHDAAACGRTNAACGIALSETHA